MEIVVLSLSCPYHENWLRRDLTTKTSPRPARETLPELRTSCYGNAVLYRVKQNNEDSKLNVEFDLSNRTYSIPAQSPRNLVEARKHKSALRAECTRDLCCHARIVFQQRDIRV